MYHKCPHDVLSLTELVGKNWLKFDSPSYITLKQIVCDKRFLNDLEHFKKFKHSGNLESFHALLNKYSSKQLFFSYDAMVARTQIAVLDHNSGLNRNQAVTKEGRLRNKSQWSKVTEQHVPRRNEKRSIAKKDNPGTEALLLNRQTRFLSKECSPLQL